MLTIPYLSHSSKVVPPPTDFLGGGGGGRGLDCTTHILWFELGHITGKHWRLIVSQNKSLEYFFFSLVSCLSNMVLLRVQTLSRQQA